MKKTSFIAGSLLAICSSLCVAGQAEKPTHCSEGAGTLESADNYMHFYQDHLKTGMNRKQLSGYWSEELIEIMDQTVVRLAKDLRHEVAHESQRFIDTLTNNARCEDLKLESSKKTGLNTQYASLEYSVTPTCTDWTNTTKRKVKMSFSTLSCGWVITELKDEVKYK
ncbi:hypothetical protein A3740_08890 [Oleiphilus sp. HI0068]|uniref:hypothetical protein n=1 Tax=Oleiphilus sp. HI0132 TaxID=1822270 RepID=UPI0007C353F7|nr:hypothetical protein [Oleiphilus sp. HI0132]KZY78044.1 hypothetical protein A3740_08890 [Oleiphilus sp. HI0068]KZY83187.1 hypothetical protein A3741_16730 [Oleiphilus sp. HI0069]KZZ47331.1 hypothetical protein A3755_16030 [Oleiphilus sp. HI0085]KZZ76868.1 hypothetical protein A3766_12795 [Oleiphilus sp. HI0132]KZZ80484.1 hypothetical protein A3766_23380 [Oleiphilus sp. HI0132]